MSTRCVHAQLSRLRQRPAHRELRGEAAKLFTDLNVGAEPRELHQLFQRYTCWMPHRDAKLDYGNPADVEVPGR